MESSQILIAGVGGLGCSWAKGAWSRCNSEADILLIDADEDSFNSMESGHVLRLGTVIDKLGCAALPPLAEQRMRSVSAVVRKLMEPVELVILLTGLVVELELVLLMSLPDRQVIWGSCHRSGCNAVRDTID